MLDLTDPDVRAFLGVTESQLVGDDYATSQDIAASARLAGFDAILAPAAALPGRQTLAVFVHAMDKVEADHSDVRQPPPRMATLLPLIRPHERVPAAIARLFRNLAATGAERIRQRRRRE